MFASNSANSANHVIGLSFIFPQSRTQSKQKRKKKIRRKNEAANKTGTLKGMLTMHNALVGDSQSAEAHTLTELGLFQLPTEISVSNNESSRQSRPANIDSLPR